VTFSHAMVREYLTEKPLETMPPQSTIALACLTCFQDPRFDDPDYNLEKLAADELPFFDYAAKYWAGHSKLAGRNDLVESKIFETFNSENPRSSMMLRHGSAHDFGYANISYSQMLPFLVHNGMAFLFMSNSLDTIRLHQCMSPEVITVNKRIAKILDPSELEGECSPGSMAFLQAVYHGYLDVATWLCEKGIALNSTDWSGGTAVHAAAFGGRLDVVKWLVDEKKLNADAKNGAGMTLAHWATVTGHLEVLKWLIEEKNADINATEEAGMTMVKYAARNGKFETLR
jgi:hypothetical protein